MMKLSGSSGVGARAGSRALHRAEWAGLFGLNKEKLFGVRVDINVLLLPKANRDWQDTHRPETTQIGYPAVVK